MAADPDDGADGENEEEEDDDVERYKPEFYDEMQGTVDHIVTMVGNYWDNMSRQVCNHGWELLGY